MSLLFTRIENGDIFKRDFSPLVNNNEIKFPNTEEIVAIYGPNGTGKTSLIRALAGVQGTKVEFNLDGTEYRTGVGVFHIINDQNNRNIIHGDTRDFFLGDNIRREFELQEQVASERNVILSTINSALKTDFSIGAANSPLIEILPDVQLNALIKDCANNQSKGKNHPTESLLEKLASLTVTAVPDYDPQKLKFVQSDLAGNQSIIKKLEQLVDTEITPNIHAQEIEENTEAIHILSRFRKERCIVCDRDNIDWQSLLEAKTSNREATLNALDEKIREIIERIIALVPTEDPFGIKEHLLTAITRGDTEIISLLCEGFSSYKRIYSTLLVNRLVEIFAESELNSHYLEYQAIIAETPNITDEDYLYIQEIISNSMSKPLTVERDEARRLKVRLSNQEFFGKTREELPLSTGEQNFLSLTFEFLKAKNSTAPIVIIDDPVSSFDSIYKNKVVYAIVKMLHSKKRIVLTHNIDLIRLLDGQYRGCFKLYLLNNTEGEMNGFIPLRSVEQEMLINLEKLLTAFRTDVPKRVMNQELFLIAMIPFMRGYANIVANGDLYNNLTQVMHGYKNERVDIGKAYSDLFGHQTPYLPDRYEICVNDILGKTVDGIHVLDPDKYPLLDRTLRHSFVYLFLRLMVEKNLVVKFGIDTTQNEQLGQIISAAYPDENDVAQIRNRIRLTSKKTLINEFNHFEGNLSIFQPAIDITDQALGKERTDLITFISTL